MGWVDELGESLVGIDTAPLIYYMEAHPTYLPLLDPLFAAVDAGRMRLVTSTITLVEVLTQPLRRGAGEIAARYRDLLQGFDEPTIWH